MRMCLLGHVMSTQESHFHFQFPRFVDLVFQTKLRRFSLACGASDTICRPQSGILSMYRGSCCPAPVVVFLSQRCIASRQAHETCAQSTSPSPGLVDSLRASRHRKPSIRAASRLPSEGCSRLYQISLPAHISREPPLV